jgi:hypothetical protein
VIAFAHDMTEAREVQMHARNMQVIGCRHVHDAPAGHTRLLTVHVDAG